MVALALGVLSAYATAAEQNAYQEPATDATTFAPQAGLPQSALVPQGVPIQSAIVPQGVPTPSATVSMSAPAPSATELQGVPTQSETALQSGADTRLHRADFGKEIASRESRQIADWIVDAADNRGLPFVVLDKIAAKMFVFDAAGRIQGAAAALLGSARGDDSVPGIGDREFSAMPPETRTTPGGRFVAALGMDTHGKDVVWVDYEAAVSIHRVINTKPKERRLQRLASATPLDNRISYGCINVPVRFYENVVKPAFTGTDGIVYVLPETRPAREMFGAYDVDARTRLSVR
jgi:hypothetical protein